MNLPPEIRMLVVEDNPDDREMLELVVRRAGARVRMDTAACLSEGLEKYAESGADVVLLDLTLPDSSGIETVTRAQERMPDAPIIVLTGMDDEKLALGALQVGAQDYLVKGELDAGLLVRAIRYAIERKRVQKALVEMRLSLESERLETLCLIGSGIAHELQNPLMGIYAQIEYVLERPRPRERMEQVLGEALVHTRRCVEIVRDLRAIARAESDARHGRATGDVIRALHAALTNARGRLEADGVEVALDLATDLPEVSSPTGLVEQLVTNLMLNACDAMASSEPRRLALQARSEGPRVELCVRDNGHGIGPDVQERIFEPFYTTKPAGRGTGLGLSLCRLIARRSGGDIEVESAPGAGATFRILLPAATGGQAEGP